MGVGMGMVPTTVVLMITIFGNSGNMMYIIFELCRTR